MVTDIAGEVVAIIDGQEIVLPDITLTSDDSPKPLRYTVHLFLLDIVLELGTAYNLLDDLYFNKVERTATVSLDNTISYEDEIIPLLSLYETNFNSKLVRQATYSIKYKKFSSIMPVLNLAKQDGFVSCIRQILYQITPIECKISITYATTGLNMMMTYSWSAGRKTSMVLFNYNQLIDFLDNVRQALQKKVTNS